MVWRYARILAEESHSAGRGGGCFWVPSETWPTDSCVHEDDQMPHFHFCHGCLHAWFMYRFSWWMVAFSEQAGLM